MQKKMIRLILLVLILFLASTIPLVAHAENIRLNQHFTIFHDKSKSTNFQSYDMIIITPESYSSSLESFIELKNNIGIITKLVTLEDIYSGSYFEVKGRDNQEKIKYFIKDSIENWNIIYVLFVGSINQVPVRDCYNNDNYSNNPELKFISELYYADIYDDSGDFSSWDSDGDGIFGEWNGDTAEDKPINLTPDVCLGRLACIDKSEVEIVVNKIINYENQPADPSWFKRMIVVGGDTYEQFEGYEGEINNQRAIDSMDGFTPIKFWVSNGKLQKNGWNIINEINKGCGFWYLSGHGNIGAWVTYTFEPEKTPLGTLYGYHLLFLRNKHKLPVCLVGGCHNSQFSVASYNLIKAWNPQKWLKECWSWQLVSKPNGGSIATLGATGLAWYGVEFGGGGTDWLNVQFFKEYSNDTLVIGQIWKNALSKYIETFPIDWETPSGGVDSIDAKTIQEWTLLGDPSLKIGGNEGKTIRTNI